MSEQPQVTVQTLSNIVQIIDVCTKRGAFQASELALVGKTYDELNNFDILMLDSLVIEDDDFANWFEENYVLNDIE